MKRTPAATRVGVRRSSRVPSPIWPPLFAPQQYMSPAVVTPQVWFQPTAIAPKRIPPATSPGRVLVRPAPVPNWPYAFDPQHEISPARDNAHECENPARTVLNGPAAPTLTGVF